MSTATIAGKLAKLMEPAPTVKELDSLDATTRAAVKSWAISEDQMPGSFDPPSWLRAWMDGHAAELFVQGAGEVRETVYEADGEAAADDVFSRDEDPPEEEEDAEPLDVEFIPEGDMSDDELMEALKSGAEGAATVSQLRARVLDGGGAAMGAEGLAGAIWRARQAVIATDYLEGAEMTEDAKRGFAYKATRDAFEALRIIWAAEGLCVVPVDEQVDMKRFGEQKGNTIGWGSASTRVKWVVEHLPSGEKSEPLVTSGVGVGPLGEAFQAAKTVARKQMLCDAFGVQIHTQDMDTEARKR